MAKIKVHVRFKAADRNLSLYYVDPHTGKEVTKSSGTRDLREADRAASRWEDEIRDFRGEQDDAWSWFRERFREEHLHTLASKTQAIYKTSLDTFERYITIVHVSDVTPNVVSTFQVKMLDDKYPLSTIGTYLTHLRGALNWAESVGIIREAPAVRIPKQPQRLFMRGRPLTEVEYRAMLRATDAIYGDNSPQWRRFLELLWLSGLRLGEAKRLSWDTPPLVADLESQPYPQLLFYAEGHKAGRDLATPMTPDLAAWLQKTPPKQRKGAVAPVHVNNIARLSEHVKGIGKKAGIVVGRDGKFASAHDLRRSFGTRWASKVMPATLQKIMRHAVISTTLKYYVNMTSADAGRELWQHATVPKTVPKNGRSQNNAG